MGDHLAAAMPPRVRPPGDVISYSNYGAALAAHIVENVAGISRAASVDPLAALRTE
jgi:CubicO group peptidase (beta-lactamase class C family)